MSKPFFNGENMPNAENQYVLWIDIMGTKSSMSNGVKTSSIYICKLHVAILESKTEEINIYPVMDGAYVTSSTDDEMSKFIHNVFDKMKELFISDDVRFRFLVKGALAYGPIIHGKNITERCSGVFKENRQYLNSLMLGLPMIQAAKNETLAAPFGIYCDESVRQVSNIFCHRWYKWYFPENDDIGKLKSALKDYFEYAEKHSYEIDYEKDRIKKHKEMCFQFFYIDEKVSDVQKKVAENIM